MGLKDFPESKTDDIFVDTTLTETPKEPAKEHPDRVTEDSLIRNKDILDRIMATRSAIKQAERVAKWLDDRYLDPILGLVPEVGDILPIFISAYIVGKGLKLGMPATKIIRMLANIGIDAGVGMIPVLGDIFDFFFKANKKNVEIIKEYLAKLEADLPPGLRSDKMTA